MHEGIVLLAIYWWCNNGAICAKSNIGIYISKSCATR